MALLDKVYELLAAKEAGTKPEADSSDKQPGKLLAESSPDAMYADLDKIRARITETIEDHSKVRWAFERNWFRCILYYIGNQWLSWDQRSSRWREKKLVRKWVPKPCTNRYASTIDAIAGALQSFQVSPSVWPATTDADDLATAEVADRLIPVIDEEVDMPLTREDISSWMSLNADCIVFSYYDHADKSHGMRLIQHHRCLYCGHTDEPMAFEDGNKCPNPACTGGGLPSATEPAVDAMGQPIGTSYPIGRNRADALSPLQIYLNQNVLKMRDQKKFVVMDVWPVKTVKETWLESGVNVQADKSIKNKTGQYFMQALAHISEEGGFSSGRSYEDSISLYRYVEWPSTDFPDGLCATMASDNTVLEVGPSPFYEELLDKQTGAITKVYFNPLTKFTYRRVPGRLYGKTPAYDLVGKADQLNRVESLIEMAFMKGVYTSWLLPVGSSISNITGEPAQVIRWTPQGTNGAKPEVVTQNPIPPILLEWKQQIEADFEEIGGIGDVLKGQTPKGVSAGYAIQLLTERSFGKFGPVFENMQRGYIELYAIQLKLARRFWTEERLRRIRGASGQWQIDAFKGADLTGAVDVKIEGGTARPRSKVAEQALLQTLTTIGALDPKVNPETQYQICEQFGMQHMLGPIKEDKRVAAHEWEMLTTCDENNVDPQTGKVVGAPEIKILVDDHMVHLLDHKQRAKTDQFDALPPSKKEFWMHHILLHMQALQLPTPGMPQAQPKPGEKGSGQAPPEKPELADSKNAEVSDQTPNVNKEGGNVTLGA